MIPRMMHKFGYDYEPDSQVMAVLKESFESKCRTYFAGTRVNKMGTKDKRELKERTGFQLSTHPVLSLFDKIHRANIWPVLQEALSAIVAVSE